VILLDRRNDKVIINSYTKWKCWGWTSIMTLV